MVVEKLVRLITRHGRGRRPPQTETLEYCANIGGSSISRTLCLAERKHPGADTTGTLHRCNPAAQEI